MKTPKARDAVADVVLAHRPKPKSAPANQRERRIAKGGKTVCHLVKWGSDEDRLEVLAEAILILQARFLWPAPQLAGISPFATATAQWSIDGTTAMVVVSEQGIAAVGWGKFMIRREACEAAADLDRVKRLSEDLERAQKMLAAMRTVERTKKPNAIMTRAAEALAR